MRIYFVRHGNPNYENDCLTEIGHLQAKACAKRLKGEGIQKVCSSSQGRAIETAEYTARELGLSVETFDFIRELGWKSKTDEPIYKDGNPWFVIEDMVLKGEDLFDGNWAEGERFSGSILGERAKIVTDGLDAWLRTFGYEREGNYYRVVGDNTDQTVAMFSHGGASSAAMAHLLGVPLPWFFRATTLAFTSITIIELGNEKNTLTFPQVTLLNDARHIENIDTEVFFGN